MSLMSDLHMLADEVDRLVGPGITLDEAIETRIANHPSDEISTDEVAWAYDELHGDGEIDAPF